MKQVAFQLDLTKMPFSTRGSLATIWQNPERRELEVAFALARNFGVKKRTITEIYPTDAAGETIRCRMEASPCGVTLHGDNGPRAQLALRAPAGSSECIVFRVEANTGLHLCFPGPCANFVRRGSELAGTDYFSHLHFVLRHSGASPLGLPT